ncbi:MULTISPECIES: hypothetical protein [unclassified Chelatococcus]|uniref:hypothetical protein n=1 Tax=unclassified Chelatococcus TaxID=2638111 RepID=UPI001BD044D2|nr:MULTISPECIES: hypothetical protein [unclassified Chelatococcus]MBS7743485.1 hypothetical protein [Chelatococcus sp. HY11]MBX3547075.1 hypothetical protein [Chelatococcus sp.]CAH1662513.1 hypothetical protein CHELA20_40062 [Hyphomicrobiales bacterium]CAH1687674.1 hypothetical protein CHELA41_40062 [Hyphomicrobiales bacterium]
MTDTPTAWPTMDLERVALTTEGLAERLTEPELRAQVFSLAAVIRHIGREQIAAKERLQRRTALAEALAAGEEAGIISAARSLATLDREAVLPVDWGKVTGG